MQIIFNIQGKDIALLSDEHNFILASQRNRLDKESGTIQTEWTGFSFHSTIEHALTKLLTLKVRSSEATNLKELKADIEQARKEIADSWTTAG